MKLFQVDSILCFKFHIDRILSANKQKEYSAKIRQNGGHVVPLPGDDVFSLTTRKSHDGFAEAYDIKFIDDCLQSEKILDIGKYRLDEGHHYGCSMSLLLFGEKNCPIIEILQKRLVADTSPPTNPSPRASPSKESAARFDPVEACQASRSAEPVENIENPEKKRQAETSKYCSSPKKPRLAITLPPLIENLEKRGVSIVVDNESAKKKEKINVHLSVGDKVQTKEKSSRKESEKMDVDEDQSQETDINALVKQVMLDKKEKERRKELERMEQERREELAKKKREEERKKELERIEQERREELSKKKKEEERKKELERIEQERREEVAKKKREEEERKELKRMEEEWKERERQAELAKKKQEKMEQERRESERKEREKIEEELKEEIYRIEMEKLNRKQDTIEALERKKQEAIKELKKKEQELREIEKEYQERVEQEKKAQEREEEESRKQKSTESKEKRSPMITKIVKIVVKKTNEIPNLGNSSLKSQSEEEITHGKRCHLSLDCEDNYPERKRLRNKDAIEDQILSMNEICLQPEPQEMGDSQLSEEQSSNLQNTQDSAQFCSQIPSVFTQIYEKDSNESIFGSSENQEEESINQGHCINDSENPENSQFLPVSTQSSMEVCASGGTQDILNNLDSTVDSLENNLRNLSGREKIQGSQEIVRRIQGKIREKQNKKRWENSNTSEEESGPLLDDVSKAALLDEDSETDFESAPDTPTSNNRRDSDVVVIKHERSIDRSTHENVGKKAKENIDLKVGVETSPETKDKTFENNEDDDDISDAETITLSNPGLFARPESIRKYPEEKEGVRLRKNKGKMAGLKTFLYGSTQEQEDFSEEPRKEELEKNGNEEKENLEERAQTGKKQPKSFSWSNIFSSQ